MIIILQIPIDWSTVGKLWGPLGIVFVLAIFAVIYIAKMVKKFLEDTIADARKERDRMAERLQENSTQFIASLRYRDDKMVEQFDKIVTELKINNVRKVGSR